MAAQFKQDNLKGGTLTKLWLVGKRQRIFGQQRGEKQSKRRGGKKNDYEVRRSIKQKNKKQRKGANRSKDWVSER